MSFLWLASSGLQWKVLALGAQLTDLADLAMREGGRSMAGFPPVLLRDGDSPANPRWVLLAGPGADVTVNGGDIGGIRLLSHRDELRVGGKLIYFSTEKLARIEPFTGPQEICCGRCLREIAPHSPVVRCPQCGIYHHATAESPCWEYAPVCSGCGEQPTQLDADFRWTPD